MLSELTVHSFEKKLDPLYWTVQYERGVAAVRSLTDGGSADTLKQRVDRLRTDSQRLWGTMSPAQAVAHCSSALEMAMGTIRPRRALLGRVIGSLIKSKVLGNDDELRRNTTTVRELVVADERDLHAERARLRALIDRFVAGSPTICTTHPHAFFGSLKPTEWAVLMYRHLDHHLRQFGV